jgi:preprotein translocase subunit SecE
MATKKTKDKTGGEEPKKKKAPKAAVREPAPPAPEPEADELDSEESDDAEREDALVVAGGETAALDSSGDGAHDQVGDELPSAAREEDEGEEEEVAATSLGSQRYVMAGFFAAAMIGAFVAGKIIHGLWATFSNKDWFSQTLPTLAAVNDDDKNTYAMVIGAVIALVVVVRQYRKPDVRAWTDEVAAELSKVKWPTRKDVSNSTVVVIAASTVATVYLALLDRLWSFVTNLVYGSGT